MAFEHVGTTLKVRFERLEKSPKNPGVDVFVRIPNGGLKKHTLTTKVATDYGFIQSNLGKEFTIHVIPVGGMLNLDKAELYKEPAEIKNAVVTVTDAAPATE